MWRAEIPDADLTDGQRAFRAQVREFFQSAPVVAAVDQIRRYPPGVEAGLLDVYRWLGERGWLAPSWPSRYGGQDRTLAEAAMVTEEMCLAGVPDDAHVLSIDIVGNFLLQVGTDDQRRRWLPSLAAGERIAAVLFTEPGCGSDLSRLTTRAEPDGDGWRIFGTKIYNQKTQFADVALCAARTSDGVVPFDGITLFLLPLRAPGVLVRPVRNITNDNFHEVVLDGARLGAGDVLGSVGNGWQLLNEMLVLERTGIDFGAKIRRWLDATSRVLLDSDAPDPELLARLAVLDGRLRAGQALAWRVINEIDSGRPDPVTAAMAKWYVTEQAREVARFSLDVRGLPGVLSVWDQQAPDLGISEAAWRYAPVHRLGSGTSEVMLYIIASSALELL